MEQGTTDVTSQLQKRTNPSNIDRLLMVNPETQEPQYIEMEQIKEPILNAQAFVFDDEVFDDGISGFNLKTATTGRVIRKGDVLSNIISINTGEELTFIKQTNYLDGTPMSDSNVDGIRYRKLGSEYFKKAN